ncbi:AraC family transcriptional regulator [Paenibacillus oryzisoli]|uniref:AraC family transcriptional regulator n=1 Tax=Paenibacillus oryzisoli TaxID=1850517 RepID=UPI003D26F6A0
MTSSVRYTHLNITLSLGLLDINVLYITYEPSAPGWTYPNHCHSSYEMHFIPNGLGTLQAEGRHFNIVPGVFYLTGPGIYHEQQADLHDPMSEYCINFEIKAVRKRSSRKGEMDLGEETREFLTALREHPFWFGEDARACIPLFEMLFTEFKNELIGHYTAARSLISLIIVNAIRSLLSGQKSRQHIPTKILDDSRRHLTDEYFNAPHLSKSPVELAKLLRISTRQVDRVLKQYYRLSFKDKRRQSCLDQAKVLLRTTELTIQYIAELFGFTPSYFSKTFRASFGITPLQYRSGDGDKRKLLKS